ncbi:MAG: D-2-hydroxyacid dehydrogenase [Sphingopyxis sp.]
MTIFVASAMVRPLLEQRLPSWVEAHWFASKEEALELAPLAKIGWFDMYDKADMAEVIAAACQLKWLNSIYAGVDGMPLDLLEQRGVTFTNGAGINAVTIAEYVVMAMLTLAKGYREVVRAQDRHEWLQAPPGRAELFESRALLIGYGAIGRLVEARLHAFGVGVSVVRRNASADHLGPDQWRDHLGDYDWIILALPATHETDGLIGTAELGAMKPSASLINIARGSIVDQDALALALREKRIGAAFLDVTTPEPLPADHPLWALDNAHISMHLSGQSQDKMFVRSVTRFLANLDTWHSGGRVEPQVDLGLGY